MNHIDYFSEIEQRFTVRRGSLLLLSTLDWALIETWREAGIPLPAVLRGIDDAFDRYEERRARAKGRLAKVNGLAWCSQAVMEAATALSEATTGMQTTPTPAIETGFEAARVTRFLDENALALGSAATAAPPAAQTLRDALADTAHRLRELARDVRAGAHPALDELDRNLTVLEERLHAAVVASTPEHELLKVREIADKELVPYRTRMGAVQARQVRESFVHKRLFEQYRLPRLSLFYMPTAADLAEDPPPAHNGAKT